MTQAEFFSLCKDCENMLRVAVPGKTGKLRCNAIKLEMTDADTCRIYVDENIAPYMQYTNEPWSHGKNPNEGWFDRVADKIARHIAQTLQGELKT